MSIRSLAHLQQRQLGLRISPFSIFRFFRIQQQNQPLPIKPVQIPAAANASLVHHTRNPKKVHVWMVSLLWQMRSLVPAICRHMRQKDDKLWARRFLHDARAEECCLWILCQREVHECKMHGLPPTRPLGWIVNRRTWEDINGSDLHVVKDTLYLYIDASYIQQ